MSAKRAAIAAELIRSGVITPEQAQEIVKMDLKLPDFHFQPMTQAEVDRRLRDAERRLLFSDFPLYGTKPQLQPQRPDELPELRGFDPYKAGPEGCMEKLRNLASLQQMTREANVRLSRQVAELSDKARGLTPIGYVKATEVSKIEAQLMDAREALRIERQRVDELEAELADVASAEHSDAVDQVVECAMRYVKVQSARYQRELLEAIDQVERCPK